MRLVLLISLTGVLIASGSLHSQKIGYIDFQYLVTQVQAAQDIQTELQRLSAEWTREMEAMQDTIESLEKDLESVSLALSKSGRDMLIQNIEERRQKMRTYREQRFSPVSGDLYKKQQELLQPLIDKIKKAVDNVRMKQKYDVIFDISTGNPVSIDKRLDLTALILEEFSSVGLTLKGQAVQGGKSKEEDAGKKDNTGSDFEKEGKK